MIDSVDQGGGVLLVGDRDIAAAPVLVTAPLFEKMLQFGPWDQRPAIVAGKVRALLQPILVNDWRFRLGDRVADDFRISACERHGTRVEEGRDIGRVDGPIDECMADPSNQDEGRAAQLERFLSCSKWRASCWPLEIELDLRQTRRQSKPRMKCSRTRFAHRHGCTGRAVRKIRMRARIPRRRPPHGAAGLKSQSLPRAHDRTYVQG